MADPASDSAIRPSATVVLLRAAPDAPELLFVRRHPDTAFGNTWAFPGGVVEKSDSAAACEGLSTKAAGAVADADADAEPGLAYLSAAARELFEETGVLLATGGALPADLESWRERLNEGTLTWPALLDEAGLRIDDSLLHYFSYWVTPEGLGKRFATRFFLGEMPDGQQARHCGSELTASRWLTAQQALDRHRRGEMTMIFPTLKTLEWLYAFSSAAAAIEEAGRLAAAGIVKMLPKAVVIDGERRILLPGDPGYAAA